MKWQECSPLQWLALLAPSRFLFWLVQLFCGSSIPFHELQDKAIGCPFLHRDTDHRSNKPLIRFGQQCGSMIGNGSSLRAATRVWPMR
ncbi:hypothetical protein AFE_2489 [Acidithiobacillus ferrooxidans ATCC 23270]|uniref:Uncharacterized protein n=1 Tax=Acidithiobacillus ferrooxidans (strain ATCC 23270 / DSM 14882 / CIP 104768 / NCIMB 8455) TaxID=243159 RepID=B7J724_ACIF2|nr:hypothetical protein AFE_2489 [Acidithiobacillus ferrooxidans ATCC 23270]